jgi:hypothetical protein
MRRHRLIHESRSGTAGGEGSALRTEFIGRHYCATPTAASSAALESAGARPQLQNSP